MPVHVADRAAHRVEQSLVESRRVGERRGQGELSRRAEQREQPAAAVSRRPYEQRSQLAEAPLALAEVPEGVEQLAEVTACAEGRLPVGAAGVQVREQQLIPLAG
ncbi:MULTISPECIES: hypothetical protein [unclassified Streptomyces]|uniref:hypothetical protein n=1 Tax=unclassified Streptomyces TaxID=2593676 RepID=UPI0036E124EE